MMLPVQINQKAQAFSFIEMIATLAVIAILAAALLPMAIRQLDRIASDQESAQLLSIADALQQAVHRTRSIPTYTNSAGVTNWAAMAARQLGVSASEVQTNRRSQPRFFLIDTNFTINGQSLPYLQTSTGATNVSASPRLIILSSIGQPLINMNSGVRSASDFNAVWDWNDVSTTPPSISSLSSLKKGSDLKVQRLHLGSLFLRLILTTNNSHCTPRYAIGGGTMDCSVSMAVTNLDAFFIQSTVLTLFAVPPGCTGCILDSEQVLNRDAYYIYNEDVWRDNLFFGSNLMGLDILTTVDRFLKAFPNVRAEHPGIAQQQLVVATVQDFMDSYVAWASTSPPFTSTSLRDAAMANNTGTHAKMMAALKGLYQNGGANKDYNPTNTPCF